MVTLVYDGTDFPEIVTATISGLTLDVDYTFFVTGLNPFEGDKSDFSTYRLGGRPNAPGQIIETPASRTGNRIGLEWTAPSD